jgi:spermidine synthase
MSLVLWSCYLISGAAALALEMLWMRSAALVLGGTASTTAAVLACYFTGLALGAAAAARPTARPARRYALLELAAAVGAVWSVVVLASLRTDTAQRALASWPGGGMLAIAIAIVPATLCFGATLPAIGQALAPRGTLRWRAALLYALNTVGALLGIAAAGFGLPAAIGVLASYAVATALSTSAGLLALSVARAVDLRTVVAGAPTSVSSGLPQDAASRPPESQVAPQGLGVVAPGDRPHADDVSHERLYIVAASSGALGLGLEVLWVRFFAQVLHNSVYSFTAVTLVIVAGLALGAAAAALLLRRFAARAVASAALVSCALATIAGFWLFIHRTEGLAYVGMHTGLAEYLGRIVLLTAATAGSAALASGAILPALWAIWGDANGAARPLGTLAAANTLGGAAGALAMGFVAVPTIGMRAGLLLSALGYLVVADTLAGARLRPFLLALALAVPLVDPLRAPLVHLRTDSEAPRALLEGSSGVVSVVDDGGDLQLRLDNYYVLGGTAAAANERRLGLLPLLLHPHPQRVAFIGLATGITASAAPALDVPDTTVVEIVPEVATAARTHFAAWNNGVLDQPNVHLVLDDGRRFLQATPDRFDVIVSDLFIPWHAGTSSLYAREMYATVAHRLTPDGLFCQWLPFYQLTREEFDVIAHTFLAVFPDVHVWRADFYPDRPVVALVGRLGPSAVNLDEVRGRIERLPVWSRDGLLASPLGLAMLHAGDLRAAAGDFADAALNTDDRPHIEFLAPRLTRMTAAGDQDWFTGESLAAFYDALATHASPTPAFRPESKAVAAAERAGRVMYRYAIAATRGDSSAPALADEVRQLAPEVILAAEATNPSRELIDAQRSLAALREEQESVQRELEAVEHRLEVVAGRPGAAP